MAKTRDDECTPEETIRRRDAAVRRAMTSPPKPHKEMKKGKQKPATTASEKKP